MRAYARVHACVPVWVSVFARTCYILTFPAHFLGDAAQSRHFRAGPARRARGTGCAWNHGRNIPADKKGSHTLHSDEYLGVLYRNYPLNINENNELQIQSHSRGVQLYPKSKLGRLRSEQEIYNKLCWQKLAFHNQAQSLAVVYNWFNEFKCGHINLTDDLREGCPSMATTEDNIGVVRLMIETNKRVIYQQIWSLFGIGNWETNYEWSMERGSNVTSKERSTNNNVIDVRPPQPAVNEARPNWLWGRGDGWGRVQLNL
ncbi:hypothetical protein EVAR_14070_1 [Eumeta japonica]|uniref:Mos1 transposase HTH domain-containing protein n=1 Tax=Eumeta variegata TaxID=151549 RepID=A0A4C1UN65_EUMVA|nr:hypothetical protein EVAR_14070_1 [Eumeta japonica]